MVEISNAVDEDSMAQLLGHSITYRIAVDPQQGRKVFTLQTLPACDEPQLYSYAGCDADACVVSQEARPVDPGCLGPGCYEDDLDYSA